MIEKTPCLRTRDLDFAHVAHIEGGCLATTGKVLLQRTPVGYGHFPAGEAREFGSETLVKGKQWRA